MSLITDATPPVSRKIPFTVYEDATNQLDPFYNLVGLPDYQGTPLYLWIPRNVKMF